MARFIKMYVERPVNFDALKGHINTEVRGALNSESKVLAAEVKRNMRYDLGDERKSVERKVIGRSGFFSMAVWSTKIQALIDEYGRRPGAKMPPWRAGSALFGWVVRHGLVERILGKRKASRTGAKQGPGLWEQAASFIVARSIARKGIKARKPFERAMNTRRGFIIAEVNAAVSRAVGKFNNG